MADTAQMLSPLSIKRLFGSSLDADYSFENLESLTQYATTSPLAYAGQLLYDKSTGVLYKVNMDKSGVDALGGLSEIETLTLTEYNNYWDNLEINPKPAP